MSQLTSVNPFDTIAESMAAEPSTRTTWDLYFAGKYVGLADDIKPDLKFETSTITTGTTGKKLILGYRFEGVSGMIKATLRQLTTGNFELLNPWSDGSFPINMTPPMNADFYQWADKLVLHPHGFPLEQTALDLVFGKACPMSPPAIQKDGSKDDFWEVEFGVMVDRELLAADPTRPIIGYIGQ